MLYIYNNKKNHILSHFKYLRLLVLIQYVEQLL